MREIEAAVPRVATIRKPRSCSWAAIPITADLSVSVTVRNTVPDCGSRAPAAACALANAAGKSAATPITSPVERISGPSSASAPAKRSNGSTASLTETWSPPGSSGQVQRREPLPEHHPAGELGQRQPGRLGHERDRPRGARVGLDHVQVVAEHAVLDVDQADGAERERDPARGLADLAEHLGAERVRRQHAGRVAGVDPGLLDVLHDAADPDVLAVADRVDVDLDRVLQEAVEEDLAAAAVHPRQVVAQAVEVVDDLHRPPAEHVARPHEQRPADPGRGGQRLLGRVRGRVRRRAQPELAAAARRSARGPRPGRSPPAGCRAAARRRPPARPRA